MENRHGQHHQHHLQPAQHLPESAGSAVGGSAAAGRRPLVFDKMESLVREMQDPENGVPVRSQKLFLTSIPSAFMGYDMIEWLMERLCIEDSAEAIHMANLLCQHGYFFPVGECKNLVVKDDSSLYRFQTPYFWPSQNHNPDNTEYTIYLYKRSLRNKQKHGLEDYEVENLNKLKKHLAHKWEFIVMQAEEQVRLAKDRKKGDKIVTDSQERAYWRAYRPPPGFFNCLELPPYPNVSSTSGGLLQTGAGCAADDASSPDACGSSSTHRKLARRWRNTEEIKAEVEFLRSQLVRARIKVSLAAEGLQHHCATYAEYDPFICPPQPSNPWLSDDATLWMLNSALVDAPTEKRVRRWAISIEDLVVDQTGLQELTNYLRKEYSHENIRFWLATNGLRAGPASQILLRVQEIYDEFLAPGAPCEINIDGRTMEKVQQEMKNPSRFTFDPAAEHVYNLLLKKDCYPRFVRSEHYKTLLANALQPSQKKRFFSFGAGGKKKSIVACTAVTQPCQTSLKRRGSDRSLSGSPPDQSAGNLGSNLTGVATPAEECDTPYRGDMPSLRMASATTSHLLRQSASQASNERRDDVCPWDAADSGSSSPPHPPGPRASSVGNRLLSTGLSSEGTGDVPAACMITSPAKTSRSSFESNPSTDLDVCPWEAIAPPVRKSSSVAPAPLESLLSPLTKSMAQPRPSVDLVCPWDDADDNQIVADDAGTSAPVGASQPVAVSGREVTPVSLAVNLSSSCSQSSSSSSSSSAVLPIITTTTTTAGVLECATSSSSAGTASSARKPSTASVTGVKISDICPWEDEESCKVQDQPFVKTYATLGYL